MISSWKRPNIQYSTRHYKSRKDGAAMVAINVRGEILTPPMLVEWEPKLHAEGSRYKDDPTEPLKYNVQFREPEGFPETLLAVRPSCPEDSKNCLAFMKENFEAGMRHLFEDESLLKNVKRDLLPEAKRIAAQIAGVDARKMDNEDPRVKEEQWRAFLGGCYNPIGTYEVDGNEVPLVSCSRKREQFVYRKGKQDVDMVVRDKSNQPIDVSTDPAIFRGDLASVAIRPSIYVNQNGARGMRYEPTMVQKIADSADVPGPDGVQTNCSFITYPDVLVEDIDDTPVVSQSQKRGRDDADEADSETAPQAKKRKTAK